MPRQTNSGDESRARGAVQRADIRKAIGTSQQMVRVSRAAIDASAAAAVGRGQRAPAVLQLGPRDFAVLEWIRDEGGAAVYRIARSGIKAASSAAVLARKLLRGEK